MPLDKDVICFPIWRLSPIYILFKVALGTAAMAGQCTAPYVASPGGASAAAWSEEAELAHPLRPAGLQATTMSDALQQALALIDGGSPPTLQAFKDLVRGIKRGDIPQERSRLEFKRTFSDDTRGWAEAIKDIVAMANFGGGIILFGIANDGSCLGIKENLSQLFDPSNLSNKIRKYSSQALINTIFVTLCYYRRYYGMLVIMPASRVFVFESDGGYQDSKGRSKKAFWKGVVYTRGPGGNLEANQSQLDALMSRMADERVRSLVAKIERVAALPPDAELIARSPAAPGQGYALTAGDTGIPVRIVDEGHRDALPIREVLTAAVPFGSIDAEVVAQTRHWMQGDRAHRVQKNTLIRWHVRRKELHLSTESADFCFVSAGYTHGYPMYWAANMSIDHLRQTIEREIEIFHYPMCNILPYVVGLYFWDERPALLGQDGRRLSGQSRNNARRVLECRSRQWFLRKIRFAGSGFVLNNKRIEIADLTSDLGKAGTVFEQILTMDVLGTCMPNLRQLAHQLDIYIHAPENVSVEGEPRRV